MNTLHVLKLTTPENEASAEFRYLLDVVVMEARRAYNRVRVTVSRSSDGIEIPDGTGDVLAAGVANILLRAPSLRRMRSALRGGLEVAVPLQLASELRPGDLPPYTLRDFEAVEARCLASAHGPPAHDASHLPVSLWTGEAFRRIAQQTSVARILEDPAPLAAVEHALVIGHAGLCHSFIDYYGETRSDVLPMLPSGVEQVLEIGCGRGHTGAMLKRELGCRVTGVELNPEVAAAAETRLDRVIVGDIAALDIEDRFDVVLAFELLEHLAEPEAFLTRMKKLVRPGGRIVLSLPNVGHYSVVGDLLAGRWDYLPIGLLCYTHLRFFTRRTVEDLLERCGFEDFELVAQRTELPEDFSSLDPAMEADLDSLSTKGFYAVLRC